MLFSMLFIVSCSGEKSNQSNNSEEETEETAPKLDIVGDWQMIDMQLGEVTPERKEIMRERLKDAIALSSIVFTEEGTVVLVSPGNPVTTKTGTYEITQDVVSCNWGEGGIERMTIDLDGDQLTLTSRYNNQDLVLKYEKK